MGSDLNPDEFQAIDINNVHPPSQRPPTKKKVRKKRTRKSRAKSPVKTKKPTALPEKKKDTPGDEKQFKRRLTGAEIRSHSAFQYDGRREYTVKLRDKDADWLEAYAAMTGGDSQTLLEWLVRAGRNDDPTKGGTVGFEFKEGENLRADEVGGGRTFKKGSTFLPPVR